MCPGRHGGGKPDSAHAGSPDKACGADDLICCVHCFRAHTCLQLSRVGMCAADTHPGHWSDHVRARIRHLMPKPTSWLLTSCSSTIAGPLKQSAVSNVRVPALDGSNVWQVAAADRTPLPVEAHTTLNASSRPSRSSSRRPFREHAQQHLTGSSSSSSPCKPPEAAHTAGAGYGSRRRCFGSRLRRPPLCSGRAALQVHASCSCPIRYTDAALSASRLITLWRKHSRHAVHVALADCTIMLRG
jgi:hypothetical protein